MSDGGQGAASGGLEAAVFSALDRAMAKLARTAPRRPHGPLADAGDNHLPAPCSNRTARKLAAELDEAPGAASANLEAGRRYAGLAAPWAAPIAEIRAALGEDEDEDDNLRGPKPSPLKARRLEAPWPR